MQIQSYTLLAGSADMANTITSLSGAGKIAVPVKATDDQFFGPADPGSDAVSVVEGETSELSGLLDYFVAISSGSVQSALSAQYSNLGT